MLGFKAFLYENWFAADDNKHLERRKSLDVQLGAPKHTKEIKRYIKNSKPVNDALLSGKNHSDVEHIDRFIENNKIPKKLNVYSALGRNAHKSLIENGRTPTYISSSPHKDSAKGYSVKSEDGYHHIAHIELPENSLAVHLGGHENEVLIARNQNLKHLGAKTVEEGDKKFKIHKFGV